MSLDYPFYERLVRQRHPAAKWWRLGDRLYYLGLISGFLGVMFAPLYLISAFGEGTWRPFGGAVAVAAFGAMTFVIGARLKLYSHTLAARDGIYPE